MSIRFHINPLHTPGFAFATARRAYCPMHSPNTVFWGPHLIRFPLGYLHQTANAYHMHQMQIRISHYAHYDWRGNAARQAPAAIPPETVKAKEFRPNTKLPSKERPTEEACRAAPPIKAPPIFNVEAARIETMDKLLSARCHWVSNFADLVNQDNSADEIWRDISTSREETWKALEGKCFDSCKTKDDFENLHREITSQKKTDLHVMRALNREINIAKINGTPLTGTLSLINSCVPENLFDKESPLLEEALLKVIESADRKSNQRFIDSLKEMQTFFVSRDYASIAKHYEKTIVQFEAIAEKYKDLSNIDAYLKEWNSLLAEFDPQHQLLLQLKEVEEKFKECSEIIGEKLSHIDLENDNDTFREIAELATETTVFKDKESLKDSAEIRAYVETLEVFSTKVRILLDKIA